MHGITFLLCLVGRLLAVPHATVSTECRTAAVPGWPRRLFKSLIGQAWSETLWYCLNIWRSDGT